MEEGIFVSVRIKMQMRRIVYTELNTSTHLNLRRQQNVNEKNCFGINYFGGDIHLSMAAYATGIAGLGQNESGQYNAAGTQRMHGHVPAAVAQLQPVSNLSGSEHLHLAIGLPLRNQTMLTELLQRIYNPASPNYRHYLTPEQFAKMFGPTEKDYQASSLLQKRTG